MLYPFKANSHYAVPPVPYFYSQPLLVQRVVAFYGITEEHFELDLVPRDTRWMSIFLARIAYAPKSQRIEVAAAWIVSRAQILFKEVDNKASSRNTNSKLFSN